MLELYGIPTSRSSRPPWALEETRVTYENIPRNFIGDTKKPEDLAIDLK